MLRDNKAFRDRFLRWKNGEKVYEAGLPNDATRVDNNNAELRNANLVNWLGHNAYIGPETRERSEVERVHRQAREDLKDYQQTLLKAKAMEGFSNLVNVADKAALVYGIAAPITKLFSKGLSMLGKNVAKKSILRAMFGNITNSVDDIVSTGSDFDSDLLRRIYDMIMHDGPFEDLSSIPEQFREAATLRNIPPSIWDDFYNLVYPRLKRNHSMFARERSISTGKLKIDNLFEGVKKGGYYSIPDDMMDAGASSSVLGQHRRAGMSPITIRKGFEERALGHETRHRLDLFFPLNDEEESILREAYDYNFSYLFGIDPGVSPIRERVTTNYDTRLLLLPPHVRHLDVDAQDRFIDAVPDEFVIKAVQNANGYGERYINRLNELKLLETPEQKFEFAKKIRTSAKKVGEFSIPIGLALPKLNKNITE